MIISTHTREYPAGWLRLWRTGPGISWTKMPPLFSERVGLRKPFMTIRGWRFKWLGSYKA